MMGVYFRGYRLVRFSRLETVSFVGNYSVLVGSRKAAKFFRKGRKEKITYYPLAPFAFLT
jgi:hypothetical protein